MKIRPIAFTVISGLALALSLAVLVRQSASAQACHDALGQPIDCPQKKKRPTPTPPPPTKTPTSAPAAVVLPVCTPDTSNLASLCGALSTTGNSSVNPGSGPNAGGGPGPGNPSSTHEGAQPHMFSFLALGGSILGGLLIGLLLPAVFNALGGAGGKSATGNDTMPTAVEDMPTAVEDPSDGFMKYGDEGDGFMKYGKGGGGPG